jgi:hypothetical protein
MADSYFIKRGEKVSGPFSAGQVKKLAKDSKFRDDDGVSNHQDGPWTPAAKAFEKQRVASHQQSVTTEASQSDTPAVGVEAGWVPDNAFPLGAGSPQPSVNIDHVATIRQTVKPDPVINEFLISVTKRLIWAASLTCVTFFCIFWYILSDGNRADKRPEQLIATRSPVMSTIDGIVRDADDGKSLFDQADDSNSLFGQIDTQQQPSAAKANTKLFDSAIRAALTFKPDLDAQSSKVPLHDELEIIKPGLKNDADREVYQLLSKVAEMSARIQTIESSKKQQRLVLSQISDILISETRKTAELTGKINQEDYLKRLENSKEDIFIHNAGHQIVERGGLVVVFNTGRNRFDLLNSRIKYLELLTIVEIYSIPTQISKGVKTINGIEVSKLLGMLNASASKTIELANSKRF